MIELLKGLEVVVCQVDDIPIITKTQQEHDEQLYAVLQRFREAPKLVSWDKPSQRRGYSQTRKKLRPFRKVMCRSFADFWGWSISS
jgi:hypothetical protein